MFRNITNPWHKDDPQLIKYKKRQEKDEDYVIPDPPELVVNNIARFNVTRLVGCLSIEGKLLPLL